jgi:hypothetical protein
MTDDLMSIRIYGSDGTGQRAREAGSAFAELLDAVAHAQGMDSAKTLGVVVTGVEWACDECDTRVRRQTRPADWL